MINVYRDILREDSWKTFIMRILESCYPRDERNSHVIGWYMSQNERDAERIVNDIKADHSITDIWQARYRIIEFTLPDRAKEKTDDVFAGIMADDEDICCRLIGKQLNRDLDIFIKRMISSIISEKGGVFIITGGSESGKTTIADYLVGYFRDTDYKAYYYEEVYDHKRGTLSVETDIVIVDDADYEFSINPYREFLRLLKKNRRKTIAVLLCSDMSKLSGMLSYLNYRVMNIPEYDRFDITEILSERRYSGTRIHPDTAVDIVNMLYSVREYNMLKTAIEMCNYIISTEPENIDI
jgi:ABC-type ATPase with predicted acetyltransferase domain